MANIVLITREYPGINNNNKDTAICHYFTREWVKMGHCVKVFVLRSTFPVFYYSLARIVPFLRKKLAGGSDIQERVNDVEHYAIDGVEICSIPIIKYVPHGSFLMSEVKRCSHIIEEDLHKQGIFPDAIIAHWFNPSMSILPMLKETFPKAKTCLTLHGDPAKRIKNVFPNAVKLMKSIDILGFRSPRIGKDFISVFGDGHKFFYCYSGVSEIFLDNYSEIRKRYTNAPLNNFIFVGRLMAYKYPKAVIDSLESIYGNQEYSLSYIGRKSDLYSELQSYVDEKRLGKKVKFLGLRERNTLPYLYDDAQCLIMISKGETFGMVYLEAMARGCIVIAGSDSGVQEIIKHGVNGFLCAPGDVKMLSSIIKQINALSAEEKIRISANARKTAEDLSDAKVAQVYYDSVMNA